MSKVDEAEAMATLHLLRQMGGEFEEELEEIRGSRIQ
jgi:hydrogenase maturation factor